MDCKLRDRPFKRDYGIDGACPYCEDVIVRRTPVKQHHCGKIGCKAKAKIDAQKRRRGMGSIVTITEQIHNHIESLRLNMKACTQRHRRTLEPTSCQRCQATQTKIEYLESLERKS